MNETVKATMDILRAMTKASGIKGSRGFADFIASRITIATTQPTLFDMAEHFAQSLNVEMQYVASRKMTAFMQVTPCSDARGMLYWLREHPKFAAAILTLKSDKREDADDHTDVQDTQDYRDIIETIEIIADIDTELGHALPQREKDIPIQMTCLSPLSHGGDKKSGNSTLFRRQEIISTTGKMLSLPYIDGNAPRGVIRDLLADHYLKTLGISDIKGQVHLWFFHALFSGGALEENSQSAKKLSQKLGGNGATKAAGMQEFREMIPPLSLLGSALGNRIIHGHVNVCKFEPVCKEYGTGEIDVASLLTWSFITRRDDNEERPQDEKSKAMIANSECLKQGTVLFGGIDMGPAMTEIEKSCLGKGLELWKDYGYFGAANRHGLGEIDLQFDSPDGDLYEQYLHDNRLTILTYLEEIGGIHESGQFAV